MLKGEFAQKIIEAKDDILKTIRELFNEMEKVDGTNAGTDQVYAEIRSHRWSLKKKICWMVLTLLRPMNSKESRNVVRKKFKKR